MASRWFRIYVVLQTIAIGTFAFLIPREGLLHIVAQVLFGYGASLTIVISAARRRPPEGHAWYWFAAGIFLNSSGILVTAFPVQRSAVIASPSLADAFWVGLYPCVMIGLGLFIRARDRMARWDLVDTSTITIGFGLLSAILLRPQFLRTHELMVGQTVMLTYPMILVYPVGDIALLAMMVRLLRGPGLRAPSFQMLIASVFFFLAADIGWAVAGTWAIPESILPQILSTMSLQAFGLLGAAAVHPSMVDMALPKEGSTRALLQPVLLAVLTVASLMTPSLLLSEALHGIVSEEMVIVFSALVLFLLIVARMTIVLRKVELQDRQLDELNPTDELTNLPNRRAVASELLRAMARSQRDAHIISIAVLDLDHFHIFNDTSGHRAGDQLLRDTAASWRNHVRVVDILGRFVADQFVAILPDANTQEAVTILERLREVTPLGQTFSVGVATWNQSESPDELVARAANALHFAKQSGRNQLVIAADEPPKATAGQQA